MHHAVLSCAAVASIIHQIKLYKHLEVVCEKQVHFVHQCTIIVYVKKAEQISRWRTTTSNNKQTTLLDVHLDTTVYCAPRVPMYTSQVSRCFGQLTLQTYVLAMDRSTIKCSKWAYSKSTSTIALIECIKGLGLG